ncbi:hypothetical protein TcCL_NonESM11027 [Trypanosoma cruzi]|nr:hypothetical protein TcCL_NonESM11027 [Trypanosoma cruzi]
MSPADPPAMHGQRNPRRLFVRHPTPSFPWRYEQHRAHTPLRPSTACTAARIQRTFNSFCAQSHGTATVRRVAARATRTRCSAHKCPGKKGQHQWMNTEAVGACSTNVLPFLSSSL